MTRLSSVVHLLNRCSPTHIARFVMSIVIFAVNAMGFRGSRAEGIKKLHKGLKAKFNTSSAVVGITSVLRILATPFCLVVNRILGSFFVARRVSVRGVGFFDSFDHVATTGEGFTAGQILPHRDGRSTAVASAMPVNSPVLDARVMRNNQTPESLAGQILKVVVGWNLRIFKGYRHSPILPLTALVFIILASVFTANAQDVVTLPAADVAQLRKLAADRDFQKGRADAAEQQRDAAIQSRENWRALYESEKKRADEVQGERIRILTDQAAADRQKIGELNADIIRLKSGRKWWAVFGAVAGGVAGYYIGKNQDRIINTITPANRAAFRVRF